MPHNDRPNDRGLIRVVQFSSAVGLGFMAAFLYSIKQVTPELKWEVSPGTIVAFVGGAAFSWLFWRVVFRGNVSLRQRIWFVALSALLGLGTLAAFAFALRGVGNEKLLEVVQGTVLAFLALAGIGLLFWKVARYLEADSRRNSEDTDAGDDKE